MGNFRISTTAISSDIQIFSGVTSRLNVLKQETDTVADELTGISSVRELSALVKGVSNNIHLESVSIEGLKDAMLRINNTYIQTEDDIISAMGNDTSGDEATTGSGQPNTNPLLQVSKKDMDKFIREYEKNHPDEAELFNRFLQDGENNNLTTDDIRRIKYLAYNAPEPYRTMFLHNLDKFDVVAWQYTKGTDANGNPKPYSCFNQTKGDPYGGLFYSSDTLSTDPRGPYTTLFHETGHLLDYNNNMSGISDYDTEVYTAYSPTLGKNIGIKEAILYDVYDNPNNPHSVTSIANNLSANNSIPQCNMNNVIDAFKNGTYNNLTFAEKAAYKKIVTEMQTNHITGGPTYEAASDVYGGVSHNALRNGYGHDDATYWSQDPAGVAPGKELWAEFFSYQMAGDTTNLNILKEYFPEASQLLEKYANHIVGTY